MRGFITKRGKSYRIAISLGKDPQTGKYKYQWVTINGSRRDAEKKLSEMLHQVDTGNFIKPGKTTVADYLEKWLLDHAKNNLTPRTYERYRDLIRQHILPDMGKLLLTQLRPEHIQRHYTTKLASGLSARTVRYHHAVIHSALELALKWGLILRNPADAVEPPRIRQIEMQTWDEYEVRHFLTATIESPYYALFYTALFTGMRRSELLGLQWQDIDFVYSQLSVARTLHHLKDGSYIISEPKTAKSRRTIALSPAVILTLKEYREQCELHANIVGRQFSEQDLVFSQLGGKPWRPNTITRAWVTLAKQAGLRPIRLHDARHTHASLMLKQGIHPKIVQERLGHASIQMTLDTYSHVAPGLQEAAAVSFDNLINSRSSDRKEPVVN